MLYRAGNGLFQAVKDMAKYVTMQTFPIFLANFHKVLELRAKPKEELNPGRMQLKGDTFVHKSLSFRFSS